MPKEGEGLQPVGGRLFRCPRAGEWELEVAAVLHGSLLWLAVHEG